MNRRHKSGIAIDDISVGTRMTVLRNRTNRTMAAQPPESDYLKGTVLQVTAISLPYLLVQAFDPLRGRANISIDVRQHQFVKVDDAYADAIIRSSGEQSEEVAF